MRRSLAAAIALTVLVLALGSASWAQSTTTRLPVLGFQESWDSAARIDLDAAALGSVGVDGVDLTQSGNGVDVPDPSMTAQMKRAHRDHLRAVFLVGNWSSVINDFSEPVAHRMLTSPRNRRIVEGSLVRSVTSQGWDGINVDLESLDPTDTTGLVAFLRELRLLLPRRDTLSVDLSNETTLSGFQSDGYDLNGIGRSVNSVVLMAYDENGPWNPHTPGPIGALPWQRAGLKALLTRIPASKVVLGVAGYGYAWRPSGAISLTDAQARTMIAKANVPAHWQSVDGEWTAHLPDGSVLWWSDARSFALRRTLAGQFHLTGLAVWDLASSDRIR